MRAASLSLALGASSWTTGTRQNRWPYTLRCCAQMRAPCGGVRDQPGWLLPQKQVYRWARCRRPLPQAQMWAAGMPLPEGHLEVLEASLAWEDLQVRARDRSLPVLAPGASMQGLCSMQCVWQTAWTLRSERWQVREHAWHACICLLLPAACSMCVQGHPTSASYHLRSCG